MDEEKKGTSSIEICGDQLLLLWGLWNKKPFDMLSIKEMLLDIVRLIQSYPTYVSLWVGLLKIWVMVPFYLAAGLLQTAPAN